MKRTIKVILISLSSLLLVGVLAILFVLHFVFTPAKITPLIQEQAKTMISCKTAIKSVDLTFFSTFPYFGIEIKDFALINPMVDAPSDTLVYAKTARGSIDIMLLWKKNEIKLKQVFLEDAHINAFINKEGKSNFDVFITDTTSTDTTSILDTFEKIEINKIKVKDTKLSYTDLSSGISTKINKLDSDFEFTLENHIVTGELNAFSPDVYFKLNTSEYVKNVETKIEFSFEFNLKNNSLSILKSHATYGGVPLALNGNIASKPNDDIFINIDFSTKKTSLEKIFKIVPKEYLAMMKGMNLTGDLATSGTVNGIYNKKSFPLMKFNLQMEEGTFAYSGYDIKLKEIDGDVDMDLDMNTPKNSKIVMNSFYGVTAHSSIEGNGSINYIMMKNMLVDLNIKSNLNLNEFESMIPPKMKMKMSGTTSGTIKTKFWLNDVMNNRMNKLNLVSAMEVKNLRVQYDTIAIASDKAKLNIAMPNKFGSSTKFMKLIIWSNSLNIVAGKTIKSELKNANIVTNMSDITNDKLLQTIVFKGNFDLLKAEQDKTIANIDKGEINLLIKKNLSDSITTPYVDCDLKMQKISALYDTIKANIAYPTANIKMRANASHPEKPIINLIYSSTALNVETNSDSFSSKQMEISAKMAKGEENKNAFLTWNPSGKMSMTNGEIKSKAIKAKIGIPTIDFDFTPQYFNIKDSKMNINKSDFQLIGKLWNIDKYISNNELLRGDFNFVSNTTDVYELMDMTSGFEPDTTQKVEEKTPGDPYIVPKGVDIALHTNIKNALLGFEKARDVKGDVYIKNGVLALDKLRFTTDVAKMQLTSLYKSPRKNNLYIGIDFHLMDVQIKDMISIVPNLDTIMPMLKSFAGKGEFHFATEAFFDSNYKLKLSTLKGTGLIKGNDLVLMDGEQFTQISKLLMFNKKTENKIDSLSAEFTIFKNEIDIYPFLLVMDKYKAVLAGRHNTDMSFDYHISVTDSPLPIKIGVNVKGTIDNMRYIPEPPKHGRLYRPTERREIDKKALEIQKMLRDQLTRNIVK